MGWKTLWLLAVLLLAGCAADTRAPTYENGELPAVSELDALRAKQVSGLKETSVDVGSPLLSGAGSGQASGGTWRFNTPPDDHAWALYSIPAAANSTPLSLQFLGSSRLWVVVADFARARWVQPQTLGVTSTQVDLRTVGSPVSLDGFVYCGVILPGASSGTDNRLLHLSLRSDAQTAPQVYYVAPPAEGGSDANPGTEQQPWATLQHAADTVAPGEGVCVLPGEYDGFMLQSSGLPGQPIVFAAQPGVRIVAANNADDEGTPDAINLENWSAPPAISYVTVTGFNIDGDDFPVRPRAGIRVVGSETDFAHHILLLNNRCLNCDRWGIFDGHADDVLYDGNECAGSVVEHGIYHSNSGDRAFIRGNVLHNNNACGLHMNGDASAGGDGIISDCTVDGNVIYDNGLAGGSGINCDGVQNSTIRNNLLFENHASGISLYQIDAFAAASGNVLSNNTIVMADDSERWAVNIQNGSFGATLRNNILLNNSSRCSIDIASDCLPGFTSDFNIVKDQFSLDEVFLTLSEWQAQTLCEQQSQLATPQQLFYVPGGILAEDYLLKPGSPGRDAGGVQNAPPFDLRGVPRKQGPKFDVGCFEMD